MRQNSCGYCVCFFLKIKGSKVDTNVFFLFAKNIHFLELCSFWSTALSCTQPSWEIENKTMPR